jgi:DNA-binding response OmpR family regulator
VIRAGGNLPNILIIAKGNVIGEELSSGLAERGYACSVTHDAEAAVNRIDEPPFDLVLLAGDSGSQIGAIARRMKQEKDLPVMALIEREMLADINGYPDVIDDFVIRPYDLRELNLRVARLLRKTGRADSGELIRCGDLIIDQARCEVAVAGRPIDLTYREYELLRFLAGHVGRVYTRDALLDKVWGYDYYGGDRTVDVHIRRLRSKVEDSAHSFIETVRNIGYRFRNE